MQINHVIEILGESHNSPATLYFTCFRGKQVNHQPHADALKVSHVVHGIEMMQLLKRKPYNTLHFDVRTLHKEYIIEVFYA